MGLIQHLIIYMETSYIWAKKLYVRDTASEMHNCASGKTLITVPRLGSAHKRV